jgi:DNA-binding response OmpR family regulator
MKIEKLNQMKVLLVEDEIELSSMLENAIGEYFFTFKVASNGKEGLELFKEIKPDLVITDINMPNMNGIEMSKEIRKTNPNLPIIILSAFSQKDYLLNAIDLSVTKYLIKPFDPDELLESISIISEKIGKKKIELKDGFIFDKNTNSLAKDGKYIKLTKREIKFIDILIDISPAILSEEDIKINLWDNKNSNVERIRTFVKRLREKTSKDFIKNIKSQGYQIIF